MAGGVDVQPPERHRGAGCCFHRAMPASFADQPVLEGPMVRLEQLCADVVDDYVAFLNEPVGQRLTGTHRRFSRAEAEAWLATRPGQPDRADWAIVRRADGVFLGEVVLNDLDHENASAGFRIALAHPSLYGRGYGTEATRLVVEYALLDAGLHRVALEVYAFNERAQHVYESCGFVVEGRLREALDWDGRRYDAILMSVLRSDLEGSPEAVSSERS